MDVHEWAAWPFMPGIMGWPAGGVPVKPRGQRASDMVAREAV